MSLGTLVAANLISTAVIYELYSPESNKKVIRGAKHNIKKLRKGANHEIKKIFGHHSHHHKKDDEWNIENVANV